ncbi:MAG: hypothetical protein K9M45_03870, partial [Kiritimatiellales bacterium]|nr:hypothetical protein [Kiritimatiellales bacterium]
MHNQTACCLISVALAMITGVFAQPADAAETDLNILSFPCISTAPVMDGKVAANEYGGQFSGMINIDTQSSYIYDSTLFTACDDETIYIAAQLELPEDGSVQPLALERDTSRLQNNADTLVVMLRPDDDAEAHRFSGYYFTVEPGGQIFDSVRDIDWDGGSVSNAAETDFVAETASNVEDGVWTVEVRIPRKKVDLVNNKPFLMSVGFKLVGISKRLSRNLHPIWFDHYNAFSRATFTDASIKVGTGNLVAGAVSPVVEIWNQAKDEVNGTITALAASARTVETVEDFDFNVKIGQEFHTETEGRIYQWGQAFQLAAGEKITLQDHHEIQNPDSYLLVVTASVDDKLLYRQALPFQSYPPLMIEYAPVPSREDIKATA